MKLADCTTLAKGKPPSEMPYYGDGAVPYLSPEYLRGSGTAEPAKPAANAVRVKDGDTIVLWDGSNAGEVFRARAGLLASTMTRIEHGAEFEPEYFCYAAKRWEAYLKAQTSGSGIPHVDKEVLGKLEILKLPPDEQKLVASILSKLDRAIEQTEALIAKKQRIKTGLMQDLLSKGIDEHGNIRSEATHAFKDSPLGRIPVEWEVASLHELADAVDPQPDHRTPPEYVDGVPYIGVSDLDKGGQIDFIGARKVAPAVLEKQRRSFSIAKGDFIFGKIGTIGQPTRIPATDGYALSANIILLKPKDVPEYVYWWMASPLVERMIQIEIHTTSQPAFGIQKIRALKIPKPKKEERELIGAMLDRIGLHINETEIVLGKLRSLWAGLMHDLLTGERCVTALLAQGATQ